MERREYGSTGIDLSIIGFGGIVVMGAEQKQADRIVAEAVERGVNYFDVAPSYGDAEERLGPALQPYRNDVFLACKTGERRREGAQAQLERSLERLRTDYFDLYQLHGIAEENIDTVFSKGGAMEVLIQAKKDGRVRHLGFSTHSTGGAIMAIDRFDFDSALFPVNFTCWLKGGFGPAIVKKAEENGVARLALKALARQKWPENDPHREEYGKCWYQPVTDRREAQLALKFALSRPITAAVSPGEEAALRLALDLAEDVRPPTQQELKETERLAQTLEPIFEKK